MKIVVLLLTICLVMWLGAGTPINPQRRLTNRPKIDEFGAREKRTPPAGVKGSGHGPKTVFQPLQMRVRKGEYVCGNKICKLTPGVEPTGCNGLCQYPL